MPTRWADVPISPRRSPFFYGWVMVAGSVMAIWASLPGQTMGVGVFTDALIEAWGLTRVQLGTAYMLGTLATGFIVPLAGSVLDRIGARAMVVIGSAGMGMSLVLLATADRSLPAAAQSATAAMAVTTLLFLLLRFFGQCCLGMVSRVVIGRWFNRLRGRATFAAGACAAFGFGAAPQLLNSLLDSVGWRGACFTLAGIIGVGVSLIGWALYRDNPEECGLEMDGGRGRVEPGAPPPLPIREFTRREALRTLSFWVFSLAMGAHALLITAITFNMAAIGAERNLTRDEAFAIFLPMAFFSVASNFSGGWLGDKVRLKYLLYAFLAGELTGTAGMLFLGTPWGQWLAIAGYGITGGLFAQLSTVVYPRFFGRRHLGAISGVSMSIMVISSALGPVFFNAVQAWTGSYRDALTFALVMPVLLLLGALRAENPQGHGQR